ncbi:MAG: TIGR01212 family radical SAM protein [Candidatus Omnitrophota bacterium]|nr:MAG: TIGR01212 family radical SAM protein [Candidatus Omnitrophota bacterium]
MEERYYSFNRYLRRVFKERVHRISIDAGFSCPNIDGTKGSRGCIYCNNRAFSRYSFTKLDIRTQIIQSAKFYQDRIGARKFIAYFQAFSSTYADVDTLKRTYDIIREFPFFVGLFVSTRPDCIDEEKIKMIAEYRKEYLVWIEYGLQTTHNHILELINRNHTYEDFLKTLELTKKYKINVGVHMIIGLPTQSYEDIMMDAERLSRLNINGVKFHLLHVLKDTELERWFRGGRIKLLTPDEYVKIICDFLERIPSHFVILRLISTADKNYLVAPLWMNRKNEIIEKIKKELESRNSYQGYLYEGSNYSYK